MDTHANLLSSTLESNFRTQVKQYRALLRWGVDKVFDDTDIDPLFTDIRCSLDKHENIRAEKLLIELENQINTLESRYPLQKNEIHSGLLARINTIEATLEASLSISLDQSHEFYKTLEIARVAMQNDDWTEAQRKLSYVENCINEIEQITPEQSLLAETELNPDTDSAAPKPESPVKNVLTSEEQNSKTDAEANIEADEFNASSPGDSDNIDAIKNRKNTENPSDETLDSVDDRPNAIQVSQEHSSLEASETANQNSAETENETNDKTIGEDRSDEDFVDHKTAQEQSLKILTEADNSRAEHASNSKAENSSGEQAETEEVIEYGPTTIALNQFRSKSAIAKTVSHSDMEKTFHMLDQSNVNNIRIGFCATAEKINQSLGHYSRMPFELKKTGSALALFRLPLSREMTVYLIGIPLNENYKQKESEKLLSQLSATFVDLEDITEDNLQQLPAILTSLVTATKNTYIKDRLDINKIISSTNISQQQYKIIPDNNNSFVNDAAHYLHEYSHAK